MVERKLLKACLSPRLMVYTLVLPIKSIVTEYLSCVFFVAEMYAELGLSQLLIKEGEIELPRPTEEDKELKRKKKLTLLELEVCFFNIKNTALFSY